ncbi:unnamed protein product [Rotaria sp. Silwood1]|nr:unnamed protein product [Rotaria sp. Silwood1]
MSTILNNDRESAEKFAQLGADFNYQDEQKHTALHYAVQYHDVNLVTWLCECGSTPTICDINGDYPIIQATEKGDYAIVKFFVTKYPTTKTQTNRSGLTALEIARKLKFTRIAELIETGEDVPESSKDDTKDNKPKHDYETLVQAASKSNERLTKIDQQLTQLHESRDSLQARIQDADERLFKQQRLTAIQRKEFAKEKETYAQQLATYECSIFLFQRQQEAILIRRKTINFIKSNNNLIIFYRTIENHLEALFHSALAAQGGYLKTEVTTKSGITGTIVNMLSMKIPIYDFEKPPSNVKKASEIYRGTLPRTDSHVIRAHCTTF